MRQFSGKIFKNRQLFIDIISVNRAIIIQSVKKSVTAFFPDCSFGSTVLF